MAGDWIKMRGNLWDDPRIASVCDATASSEATVIGALYWLWNAADQHTADGQLVGLSAQQIDRKTGVAGFSEAVEAIGWLSFGPLGASIVRFEEHNGTSAKKRAQTARRVANHRGANAPEEPECDGCNADSVTGALAREEKRREEGMPPTAPQGGGAPRQPACPYERIVGLYREALPELPNVLVMDDARKRAIKKLWDWILTSKKTDGSPRASDAASALEWLRGYFSHARNNDFVMGRTPRSHGHESWKASLDYLCSSKGVKQVLEKTEGATA